MELRKQIYSVKVRTLVLSFFVVWALSFSYSYFFVPKHKFMSLSKDNMENQLENIETLLVASRTHSVPLLLFDIDILPNIFVPRDKVWKNTLHRCKILCKHHPEEKNVITFAALATKFMDSKNEYIESLEHLGFTVHLSEIPDPRRSGKDDQAMIPSYLWMARRKHVIHIAFLYERGEDVKYIWVGPVTDRDWIATVRKIAPAIGEGWHSLDAVGAKFPRYAQAFDLSHRFTGLPSYLDGHRISVPYHIRAFLQEYSNARFIECAHEKAGLYMAKHHAKIHKYDRLFQQAAKKMLVETKQILEKLNIPFWLTGGTLLGWYRQCGIIPYDTNIEIGIWMRDYDKKMTKAMEEKNFFFKSRLGRPRDGMEMAFLDNSSTRLNMHFFKVDKDVMINVRTREEDGSRFMFTYPGFKLCWTEFVGIKVQVPCDSFGFLQVYFGENLDKPVKEWLWYKNADNIIPIGKWDKREWSDVMEIHHRKSKTKN